MNRINDCDSGYFLLILSILLPNVYLVFNPENPVHPVVPLWLALKLPFGCGGAALLCTRIVARRRLFRRPSPRVSGERETRSEAECG